VDLVMSRRSSDAMRESQLVVPIQPAVSVRAVDFEAAYRAHYRDVYRYLLAFTGSPDDADEIASETFERALRAWDRAPDPALPWLLLTARRIATDRWRRATRWASLALGIRAAVRNDAGERETEFWLWFDAVSRILTDRQREVLTLRYQRDLSDADIASIMGVSESGVRSLVSRALEVLRTHPELL
jgi:RNA polymerase sigma factor (sigma-70 family)